MKERNITLDYFKILLSILVVIIHLPIVDIYITPQGFGSKILYSIGSFISFDLSKIAVPSFFIINGYFLDFTDQKKVFRYITKMIKIYIVWTLFYLPFMIEKASGSMYAILLMMGFYHLWYLPALIGAVICIFFMRKIFNNNILFLIIAVLLFGIGYYIQQTNPYAPLRFFKYRNFLFMGIPFVLMGYLIKSFDFSRYKRLITVLLVLSLSTLIFESCTYLHKYEAIPNIYLSLFITCPAIIILILQNSTMKILKNDDIGQLSSAIFFIHPAILFLIHIPVPNIFILPFVIISSVFLSFAIIQANKSLKIFL
ncbi:acyltransferase family protein [Dysgonomonas sp. HDW5A]|uniref:acyltransferase family protein n=1 Tax=Dysgonomonas sp. HDW5A TaxID=2714926 RepID=UPI001407DBFD|nr:acyltransferase family protein [Dysgonomonas sp. HDW5A]QIK61337.1 acyltransferase family protein [Dysgonomonas sp. HDW5A]